MGYGLQPNTRQWNCWLTGKRLYRFWFIWQFQEFIIRDRIAKHALRNCARWKNRDYFGRPLLDKDMPNVRFRTSTQQNQELLNMDWGLVPGKNRHCFFFTTSIMAVWYIHPPIRRVTKTVEADGLPPVSVNVKNMWSFTSTPTQFSS